MKKVIALILTVVMITCGLGGCSKQPEKEDGGLKIGIILVGDENEGYTAAHIDGIRTAAKNLGIEESQIIWKYKVDETQACADAAIDLVESGCKAIFSNSFGHQTYMQAVAKENPEVVFVAATGNNAQTSGLPNLKNAFTRVYESRYVSGVVAGMKLQEMVQKNELTPENYDKDGNIKLGYVGAYPYEEVVSGYTAFYLGVKSIVSNVVMEVMYTNSWFSIQDEANAAKAMIADHCVIISQHADSTGAPSAVEASSSNAYSVGYNIDMLSVAPHAALTSATNTWAVYYQYAFGQLLKGEDIAVDWAEGYQQDAVAITELGSSCASGTKEKVEEVIAALKSGQLHVFDTSTFTVGGEKVTSFKIDVNGEHEAVYDGYFHESEFRSAPYFGFRIDGITEIGSN